MINHYNDYQLDENHRGWRLVYGYLRSADGDEGTVIDRDGEIVCDFGGEVHGEDSRGHAPKGRQLHWLLRAEESVRKLENLYEQRSAILDRLECDFGRSYTEAIHWIEEAVEAYRKRQAELRKFTVSTGGDYALPSLDERTAEAEEKEED